LRLSLAESLRCWEAKRPEVLGWHDPRLMQCPASVAVTWETTFLQLTEGVGGLFSSVPDRRSVPADLSVTERGTDR
jgi:hypothetical protein